MRELARDYPRIVVGFIFGVAAFASSLIVAVFYLLIMRSDGLIAPGSGIPFDAYLFVYILFLPGVLTAIVAVCLGRKLLADEPISHLRSTSIGAGVAALSFILWGVAGELLWVWVDFPAPNPADIGVIDFLALLGYGLMGLVFVIVVALGGLLGVGIHSWWCGRDSRAMEFPGA
jgi:hypothetical protein